MNRSKSTLPLLLSVAALLAFTATPALAQTKKAPLRFLSKVKPVEYSGGGKTVRYYAVTPTSQLKIRANRPLTLMVGAMPILGPDGPGAAATVTLTVFVENGEKQTIALTPDPKRFTTLSNGQRASTQRVIQVPVAVPARVLLRVKGGDAVVTFGMRGAPGTSPVATETTSEADAGAETMLGAKSSATPAPDAPTPAASDPDLPPVPRDDPALGAGRPGLGGGVPVVPLIRRRVERLSIGLKSAAVFPTGPVDPLYGEGLTNVYFGAELRYSLPFAERRFGVAFEGGRYELVDRERLTATDPFGSAVDEEVTVSVQVVPLMADFVFKQTLGRRRALFAGVGGGVALAKRVEEVSFRPTTTVNETQFGARGRAGFEQKIGNGFLVIEGTYLHLLNATDEAFIGGAFAGLQYRFVF